MKRNTALLRLLGRIQLSGEARQKQDRLVRATTLLKTGSERCLALVEPVLPLLEGTANSKFLAGASRIPLIGSAAATTKQSASTTIRAVEVIRFWKSFDDKDLRPLRDLAETSERLRRSERIDDVPAFLSAAEQTQLVLEPLKGKLQTQRERLTQASTWVMTQADKRRSDRLARAAQSLRGLGEPLRRWETCAQELHQCLTLCCTDAREALAQEGTAR